MKPEFNRATLPEYLAFGYIAGEESMYAGIRKLMPGHILTIDEHSHLETSSYWDLDIKSTMVACRANTTFAAIGNSWKSVFPAT